MRCLCSVRWTGSVVCDGASATALWGGAVRSRAGPSPSPPPPSPSQAYRHHPASACAPHSNSHSPAATAIHNARRWFRYDRPRTMSAPRSPSSARMVRGSGGGGGSGRALAMKAAPASKRPLTDYLRGVGVTAVNSAPGRQRVAGDAEAGIHTSSLSAHAEGSAPWDGLGFETYECNGKQYWIDAGRGWCHLCEEPVGGTLGFHVGDRDHMCVQLFLSVYAGFHARPPGVGCAGAGGDPEGTLGACREHPLLAHVYEALVGHHTLDALHTHSDAVRRAELQAMLWHLSSPTCGALTHVLQGRSEAGFWYSGERMFRAEVTRAVTGLMPPMAAGMMTQFTHKVWGRTNLERTFDALNIAALQLHFGAIPPVEKDHKAYFMRLIMWDLLSADMRGHSTTDGDGADGGGVGGEDDWGAEGVAAEAPMGRGGDSSVPSSLLHSSSEGGGAVPSPPTQRPRELSPTTRELVRLCRKRLVLEMTFLQTMHFMSKAQSAMARMGYPSVETLANMGFT